MLQTELNDYTFHYTEKGQGTPVLFVHGSASDSRIWEKQLEEFGQYYRAIAYSRRYHWPNEKISETADYSMLEHVADLKAFIQSIADQPVHLVGHSYGAFICLLLAMESPALIRTLVLAEPPVITLFVSNEPKPVEIIKLLFSRPRTAIALIKFGARGIAPAKNAMQQDDMEKAMEYFGVATLGRETFDNLPESTREKIRVNLIKAELLGSGFPPVSEEKIKKIRMPVLLLDAEKSPKLFRYLLDRLEELMPHAERKMIPKASHIMQQDVPDIYNAAVLTFLQEQKG